MTTRSKRKLAALNKENCEEHPRSNLAQNSNAPRSQEDYITQVSEEIEGRVTKRLSKEFSRTENRILGALARLDDFLMNPLWQGHSGATPEASLNPLSTSQGTNEDDSQNDPHPEAGLFHSQITQNSGPEEGHDTMQWEFLISPSFLRLRIVGEWSRYSHEERSGTCWRNICMSLDLLILIALFAMAVLSGFNEKLQSVTYCVKKFVSQKKFADSDLDERIYTCSLEMSETWHQHECKSTLIEFFDVLATWRSNTEVSQRIVFEIFLFPENPR